MRGIGTDYPQISLAYLPPTSRQTRATFAGAAVLLLGLAILIPFAGQPLPKINGFIAAFDAVISVADVITAALLLAHFSISRSSALRALACGYLFSAAIVVVHGLTFPGVISPTGNLGGSVHTNFRIYLLWHLGLPVALFAYLWLRHKNRTKAGEPTAAEIVVTVGVVGLLALLSCIAWIALLPAVDPVAGRPLTAITMLICAAALCLLWVFRRSALDQWLMVVALAMIVELAITALIGGRGPLTASVGFYAGRLFSLVTSTVVLIALLAETSRLYASHVSLRQATVELDRRVAQRTKELGEANEDLQLLAGLLQCLPVSAWTLKPDGTPDFVNQVWLDFSGQTLDFIRSRPEAWMTVVHPDDRERAAKAFWGGISSGQGFAVETRSLRAQDGIYRWHLQQAVVLRDAEGKVLKFVGATTDIDNQKRAEEELRASELRLRQMAADLDRRVAQRTKELAEANEELQLLAGLLQRLPVSAWTLNPDGTLDFVNQVWLEFSGQTLEFIRSLPEAWMTAIHPEDREAALRIFWSGVRSGEAFAMEARYLRAQDGTYRWNLNQAVVLRDMEGKVLKFVGTTTDIDDQKRTEEALRQAQGDLARIHRATTMGELAASLAHEISQPISGVITNGNVTLRKLGRVQADLDGVREAVTRIVRDGQRASEILARIRAQFEKGAQERELLDVNEINRETIALLRDEAMRHNISVRMELAADLPYVVGDRVQLQQVAMNLIVNGIEAMRDVSGIREMVITSERAEDEQILVSFSDTGIGLPPQLAEQIFDPFFTTKSHGTGMGLRISRSIIESHGGRLWADSTLGRGATFHLRLPVTIPGDAGHPPV
jgi:PAS domain S-box-containing protein